MPPAAGRPTSATRPSGGAPDRARSPRAVRARTGSGCSRCRTAGWRPPVPVVADSGSQRRPSRPPGRRGPVRDRAVARPGRDGPRPRSPERRCGPVARSARRRRPRARSPAHRAGRRQPRPRRSAQSGRRRYQSCDPPPDTEDRHADHHGQRPYGPARSWPIGFPLMLPVRSPRAGSRRRQRRRSRAPGSRVTLGSGRMPPRAVRRNGPCRECTGDRRGPRLRSRGRPRGGARAGRHPRR